MTETIRFDHVSFAHAPGRPTLKAITAGVPARAFVALVGASGSGKTTLLKTVNRLIEPDGGDIFYEGRSVRSYDPVELRRRVGYVFQGLGLFPHMTIAENIGLTPQLLRWPGPDIAARVRDLLNLVALPQSFANRRPAALSGGQRQRVALARALAARPKLLLLDEPFGALDPVTRQALMEATLDIHRATDMTTLMVTHDMQEALLAADRIFVLHAGELVADATPRELMRDDAPGPAADLVAAPRRQAERLRALIAGHAHE